MLKLPAVSVSRCESCAARAPTVFVSLNQATGTDVGASTAQLNSYLCKPCLNRQFRRVTVRNLTLGWLSPFSAFLMPIYLVQNTWTYARARSALRVVLDHPGPIRPL